MDQQKVSATARTSATAEEVWALVGDFAALDRWHPDVTAVEVDGVGEGQVRRIRLADGGQAVEELLENQSDARRLRYAIREGPWAVGECSATLAVRDTEVEGTELDWSAMVSVDRTDQAAVDLTAHLQAGVDAVVRRLGG